MVKEHIEAVQERAQTGSGRRNSLQKCCKRLIHPTKGLLHCVCTKFDVPVRACATSIENIAQQLRTLIQSVSNSMHTMVSQTIEFKRAVKQFIEGRAAPAVWTCLGESKLHL